MKRRPDGSRRSAAARHPTLEALLDYFDGRLDAQARRAIEDHVARPCARCQEQLRDVGLLVERMRSDRTPDVPAELRRVALDAFAPQPARPAAERLKEFVAKLLFDSREQPLPVPVRRSVGEARRLRFSLGDHTLEVEYETDSPGVHALRGRCNLPDIGATRIDMAVGTERATARPDASGHFVFPRVPPGTVRLTLSGPSGRWRIPPFEIES